MSLGLDDNHRKEQFSRAYVHAVVSAAGGQILHSSVDAGSIDLTIRGDTSDGPVLLDMQLKCRARDAPLPDPVPCDVKRNNYDDLRVDPRSYPIILVALFVPKDYGRWLESSPDEWVGRHACHWLSLRGCPALPAGQTSTTVHLPRQQQLTPAELQRLMARVLREDPL